MKIQRLGHAALLLEVAERRFLVDPGTFSHDDAFALDGLDAIVVTHQHPDHVDQARIGGLLERNPDALLLADPETVDLLGEAWTPTADGAEHAVGDVVLRGVGARHAVIVPELPRIANVGVLVSAPDEPTLFHPGDTYEYAPEGVDVLAVPLTAPWGKVSETVDFVRRVSPTTTLPIHDCTASEVARGMYWGHVTNFGGVEDARMLDQTESTQV